MIKNRVGKWWRVLPSSQRHAGTDKFLIETDRAPNEKIPSNLIYEHSLWFSSRGWYFDVGETDKESIWWKSFLQNLRSFFYTMKCKHFIFWRLSVSSGFYLFNWFVVFSFVVIIRKVPGMQLPDLASTSLFTAVGLNHKKLARPSESPTNSSRSWLHHTVSASLKVCSLKVWNVVHWTYFSSQN